MSDTEELASLRRALALASSIEATASQLRQILARQVADLEFPAGPEPVPQEFVRPSLDDHPGLLP